MDVNLYNNLKNIFNTRFKKQLMRKTVMFPINCRNIKYNRYKHTTDVVSISKEIYKKIICKNFINVKNFDEKDVEIAALYHDVGHCPYGHAGEETLNKLLSENNNTYKYSFYSGYKHNLLSAITLLEIDADVPAIVIDAVAKHSSPIPKNFDHSLCKSYNILTLNYIFRLDKEGKANQIHKSWIKFIERFGLNYIPCDCCEKFIRNPNNDNNANNGGSNIYPCALDDDTFIFKCSLSSKKKLDISISNYLFFKNPISLLGYIIKYADEISCLVNDLYYFGIYIEKNCDVRQKHIINIQITSFIKNLDFYYPNNEIIAQIKILLGITSGDRNNAKNKLIKKLIDNLSVSNSLNCQYFIKSTNNRLRKIPKYINLIEFNNNIKHLLLILKQKIYSMIHSLNIIKTNNKQGSEQLIKAYNFYMNNIDEFLADSGESQEFDDYIAKILHVSANSISKVGSIYNYINNLTSSKNKDKLINIYSRQVVFYLAKLSEYELYKKVCSLYS